MSDAELTALAALLRRPPQNLHGLNALDESQLRDLRGAVEQALEHQHQAHDAGLRAALTAPLLRLLRRGS